MSWRAGLGGSLTGPGFFLTGDTSDYLQEVQLPLIPFSLCQVFYGHTYLLPDMMCAGDPRNLKTMCEVRPTVGTGGQAQGFDVFIFFMPPWTLLLSRWVVPEGLDPAGLGSTSPCSHRLSKKPQGSLCADGIQAPVSAQCPIDPSASGAAHGSVPSRALCLLTVALWHLLC